MAQKGGDHESKLQEYCRVCARKLRKKEYKYSCTSNIGLLRSCGVEVGNDQRHIHPEFFCASCRSKAKRFAEGKQVQNSLNISEWKEHIDPGCIVCGENKGGRPVKEIGERGRPREGSNKKIASQILLQAPESFKSGSPLHLSRFLPPSSVSLTDLQCSICSNVADRPLETPCKKIVCSVCISGLIIQSDLAAFSCPSCKGTHNVTESSFPPASEVVMKVLGGPLVNCEVCNSVVSLRSLKGHISSGCTTVATYSPSKLTVGQITSRPLFSPPTQAERKAATNIVRRILASNSPPGPSGLSSQQVVKLPTAGQVRYIIQNIKQRLVFFTCF